jgi:drug/metabolite transporter (DMT)-like permease
LLYLVPPIAVLISWTWLGELPTPIELLGGLVVMVGVVIISQAPRIAARRAAGHARVSANLPAS